MPLTIDDLQAKLRELQRDAAMLDVAGAADRQSKAERAFADLQAAARAPRFRASPDHNQSYEQLATADRQAKAHLQAAMQRQAVLNREIDHLAGMLNAEERIASAKRSADAIAGMVTSARAAVRDADKAIETIDAMIAAEQSAFDLARASAGSSLLATIKARGDTSTVVTPTLDKVATLEMARLEAQHEREAAGAALSAAETQHGEAVRRLRVAQAGAAGLTHELALSAYIGALHLYQVAMGEAGQSFHPPNIHELVHQKARAQ